MRLTHHTKFTLSFSLLKLRKSSKLTELDFIFNLLSTGLMVSISPYIYIYMYVYYVSICDIDLHIHINTHTHVFNAFPDWKCAWIYIYWCWWLICFRVHYGYGNQNFRIWPFFIFLFLFLKLQKMREVKRQDLCCFYLSNLDNGYKKNVNRKFEK